ncbi:MAG: hypothetical protein NTW16_05420 [Bacteroidetes bacterium]|nr:hypothetical protein [Bacteroidota bacterium]
MKALLAKLVLFSFVPVLFLVGINYTFDPANLFDSGHKYEKEVANYLNKGLNVTNVSNMDERVLQKFFIAGMKQSPEVIVLGTSNSMYIDSDFFPGQRFINNAVSAATFNDFLAIYDLYEKKGFTPKTVVIGICPEMLNKPTNQFWVSLENEYYSLQVKAGLNNKKEKNISAQQNFLKWMEIFSLSYFQKSFDRAVNNTKIKPTINKFNEGNTRVMDGSYNDGQYYIKKTKAAIENSVKQLVNKSDPSLETYKGINPDRKMIFEHFVEYLQQKNTKVVFYLMVCHPIYYDYISKKYQILNQVEDYLLTYAKTNGIQVIGRNNPGNCGVSNFDFNDYNHLNKNGLLKLFNYFNNFSLNEK